MYPKSLAVAKREQQREQTGRDNQKMVSLTLDKHRTPMFPSFPNFAQRKMIHGHLRKELEAGFNFRIKKLSMELDSALHQVREESNHALVTGKTRLRKERMEFFANSYHEVVENLNSLSDRFLSDIDERFAKLEKFKSKTIREREEQRLNKSVDDFLNTLDQLVDEYKNIISEHVDHKI